MPATASAELSRAEDHLLLLGRKTACEKIASFLLEQSDRLGRQGASLPMGRQDIADYLGLTIETVCRTLTDLKTERVITVPDRHRIVIRSLDPLEDLASGEDSED